MARRDLSKYDVSTHAASELDYVIKNKNFDSAASVPTVSVKQAMSGNRVFEVTSDRNITRVLFISQNTELLNPVQQSLDGYVDISNLFDEVHILILRYGILAKNPVLRVAENVWLYTVSVKHWWHLLDASKEMIKNQLEFGAGFRPDLIVARDPFESAVIAYKLGKIYNRTTQLHVLDDYTSADFTKQSNENQIRFWLANYIIPKFSSVRTSTGTMQTILQRKFTIPDIDILPRYQNYEALIDSKATIDLKAKYRPFIFFMVFSGQLNYSSSLYRVIDAARFVLRNPRVGLIVLGDGPARGEFEKRAKILGIERQVVFVGKVNDVVPYLKSGNILVVGDTDNDSEELILKGAASGIPMIMSRTDKREDIFDHGESAFLCEETDIQAFSDRINDLLNDINLRRLFVENGQDIIRRQFHSDPHEYQEAYRASIEQAFFVGNEDDAENTEQPS